MKQLLASIEQLIKRLDAIEIPNAKASKDLVLLKSRLNQAFRSAGLILAEIEKAEKAKASKQATGEEESG